MTVVAAAVALYQPAQVRAYKGRPCVVGVWRGGVDGFGFLTLHPDGVYEGRVHSHRIEGHHWTLSHHATLEDAFVLKCGDVELVLRIEEQSGDMEVLRESGQVHFRWEKVMHLAGPTRHGRPHGVWTSVETASGLARSTWDYREGELTDLHDQNGNRLLLELNWIRTCQGLPELTDRSFPNT